MQSIFCQHMMLFLWRVGDSADRAPDLEFHDFGLDTRLRPCSV